MGCIPQAGYSFHEVLRCRQACVEQAVICGYGLGLNFRGKTIKLRMKLQAQFLHVVRAVPQRRQAKAEGLGCDQFEGGEATEDFSVCVLIHA